jgi:hypothetical protein
MSVTPFLAVVILLSALSKKRKLRRRKRKSLVFEKNNTNSNGKYKLSDPSHSNVTKSKNFSDKSRFINKYGNNSILPFNDSIPNSSEDEDGAFVKNYKSSLMKKFMGGKMNKNVEFTKNKKSNQFMKLMSEDTIDTDYDYDNMESGSSNKQKKLTSKNIFKTSEDIPRKYSYKGKTSPGK